MSGVFSGCKIKELHLDERLDNIMLVLGNLDSAVRKLDLNMRTTLAMASEKISTLTKEIDNLTAQINDLKKGDPETQVVVDGLEKIVTSQNEALDNFRNRI